MKQATEVQGIVLSLINSTEHLISYCQARISSFEKGNNPKGFNSPGLGSQ